MNIPPELLDKIGPGGALLVVVVFVVVVTLGPALLRERGKPSDPTAALQGRLNQLDDRVDEIDKMQERHEREIADLQRDHRSMQRELDKIDVGQRIISHMDRTIPPRS